VKHERKSGVLLHITSLPGNYSSGSFGEEARAFVDLISEAGFSYWQTLPFCMPDRYHSPYASYGAFSGNPNFIDLPALFEDGLLTRDELRSAVQTTPYLAEFDRLSETRIPLLRRAAKRFDGRETLDRFLSENPRIADFSAFMARREYHGGAPWSTWKDDLYDENAFYEWAFIQYRFYKDFEGLKSYAKKKNVLLMGDLPIYVAHESADVYAEREIFQLRPDGMPRRVAGVPPDAFSEDGQLWGNPLYDWGEMQKDGYRFFCDRMRHLLSMFDGVRLDHFRGFESYFSIPAEDRTARNGKWVKGPGRKLVAALREIAGDRLVVAEDLGVATAAVENLVQYSGFAGMRVLQFGFESDGDSVHKPYAYSENTVAYTGTHDNNTLLGYLFEASPDIRTRMGKYFGVAGDDIAALHTAAVREVFASHSKLCILPIQDILCFGADTRMNTPGRAEGNWGYRVTEAQLASIDRGAFCELNKTYGR